MSLESRFPFNTGAFMSLQKFFSTEKKRTLVPVGAILVKLEN